MPLVPESSVFRRIALWGAVFLTLALVVVLTNQVVQLADLAARVHPTLGQGVFWGLVFLLGASFAVPVLLFLRLPRALSPPESEEGPEFERHLDDLRRRLAGNRLLDGASLGTREELETALARLDGAATDRVRSAAGRAFYITAISQNGALDALVVLGIQARLVWDIARIYAQRPGPREMAYLYSNVASTAFIAGELDDADMAEAMEPALSAVMGSAAGLVPGLQTASTIFVNSVLSGTANAFLTLRVGVIAREYSRAWTRPRRRALRRSAVLEASGLLGGIVMAGAKRVSGALGRGLGRGVTGAAAGTGRALKDVVTGAGDRILSAGDALRARFRSGEELQPEPGPGEPAGEGG